MIYKHIAIIISFAFMINYNICKASNSTNLEEQILEYETILLEGRTYIDKLHQDYFDLNKKNMTESKENNEKIKSLQEENEALISVSLEIESENKRLKEEISVLLKERDENALEILNFKKILDQENKKNLEKHQTLLKERDLYIHELKNMTESNHLLNEEKNNIFQAFQSTQKKIENYAWYQIYFNPSRKQNHKVIPNDKMAAEKWFLTPYQLYIITNFVDSGVTLLSKRIEN